MITRKFSFSIATNYIRSEWKEEVELEFEDDATEEEIEDEVSAYYQEWLNENNHGGFSQLP